MDSMKYNVFLASNSPRRRELLSMLDIDYELADIIEVEEVVPQDLEPDKVPEYLARIKSDAYSGIIGPHDLYITADTVVILNGRILGKPNDEADACRMLAELSGQTHSVVTGVCLRTAGRVVSFSAISQVQFAELTDDEISYYVERYRPLDKAGAYGIQEWIGGAAIKGIVGSFYNVMGLPLHALYKHLKEFGV